MKEDNKKENIKIIKIKRKIKKKLERMEQIFFMIA